jgi:DNA polymerase III psi subunit
MPISRLSKAVMLAETQRLAVLHAMGIDVYRLRSDGVSMPAAAAAAADADVVVVCPSAASARLTPLRRRLARALGLADERVHWHDGRGAAVPQSAAAYVAIGTEAARALGVQLSTMQQNSAIMATTAEPAVLLRDAAAKRALWQALKPVARNLRGTG